MTSGSIGVVIVTWNSAEDIGDCLRHLQRFHGGPVVVVDNGSRDKTREIVESFSEVKLLYFPANVGFSGGVNRGAATLETDFVLLLNPDCLVESQLGPLAAAAGEGAAGGKLLDGHGNWQTGFAARSLPTAWSLAFEVLGLNRLFPGNPVNRRFRCAGFNEAVAQPVEQPPGAFFLVNKSTFDRLGGMDEAFWPIWFEDVDLCLRLRAAGHPITYEPGVSARHRGAGSIRKIRWSFKELAWYGSLLRYATKHFRWHSRCLVGLAVAAASVLRFITGYNSRRQSDDALGVYADVVHMAWESIFHGRVENRRLGRHVEGQDHFEDA